MEASCTACRKGDRKDNALRVAFNSKNEIQNVETRLTRTEKSRWTLGRKKNGRRRHKIKGWGEVHRSMLYTAPQKQDTHTLRSSLLGLKRIRLVAGWVGCKRREGSTYKLRISRNLWGGWRFHKNPNNSISHGFNGASRRSKIII